MNPFENRGVVKGEKMDKKEANRYYLFSNGCFADGLKQEYPAVLDHGEWIETGKDLGKEVALGMDEIEKALADWERIEAFLDEQGWGRLERGICLNADAEEIVRLLKAEREELPGRPAREDREEGEDASQVKKEAPTHPKGMAPGSVSLCRIDGKRVSVSVSASLSDGKLSVSGLDLFEEGQGYCGDDYEYNLWLDRANTRKLLRFLRADYPGTGQLLPLLEKAFAGEGAWAKFERYCADKSIKKDYFSI